MSFESIEAAIAVLTGERVKPKKRLCQLCDGQKAVGRYYLDPSESENHGWWRVCSDCAEMVSRVGAEVQYYKYSTPQNKVVIDNPDCEHQWTKWSLVGEVDKKRDLVFDWMRCEKCSCYGKRFRLGQIKMEDLCMEIDLSCSR
ncbi:hypothetical protein ACRN9J_18575 [Shewanella baltica]|uniref:hypothetical protein n=1 Tax=Shewanella baltica TaxID=62322 RepID=UPI0024B9454A|nr:hypothetical protein [Shewanella baltica]